MAISLEPLFLGTLLVIKVSGFALVMGILWGLWGAFSHIKNPLGLGFVCAFINLVIKGLPEIIVIFAFYFAGPVVYEWTVGHPLPFDGLWMGVIGLGALFGAYATGVFLSAYGAIGKGPLVAGKALGLNRFQVLRYLIFPQGLRHCLMPLSNLWLILLKDTALLSLIGGMELLGQAQILAAYTLEPLKYYGAACLIYLALSSVSGWGFQQWQKRLLAPVSAKEGV